jgi:hypothetical protein
LITVWLVITIGNAVTDRGKDVLIYQNARIEHRIDPVFSIDSNFATANLISCVGIKIPTYGKRGGLEEKAVISGCS